MAFARAVPGRDGGWRFQPLEEHLANVAGRAGASARSFGAEAIAELAGRWHDLGKYAADFQAYLLDANGIEREEASSEGVGKRVDHSSAGALHAMATLGAHGSILAQLIAAHHAGLYDAEVLKQRLAGARQARRLEAALDGSPPAGVFAVPAAPPIRVPGGAAPGAYALWLRMLFSCLVDADVLDSEAFSNPERARARGSYAPLAQLKPAFDHHMAQFVPDTPVRRLRAEVLADCRRAAAARPGLFTLTVPTGGGKTLASMAFALEHALQHGLRRVIYVIPYTSIIEQTADVFRSIFGDNVVEHHSNLEGQSDGTRARLASENWDAPIIVTTNVQFFESLFASRTRRCRKLHNILESVVVLDEAQLLPPAFLQPIVDMLRLLTANYGISAALSTATQPVLASREHFGSEFRGLDDAREIVPDPDRLYRELQRVEVRLPTDLGTAATWAEIAEQVASHDEVLAIVNRRADARDLHQLLPLDTLHLSALMCGAHRSDAIAEIKRRLQARRDDPRQPPLRVVSTQLVEAGVDLDFATVFRALAGLDSIAQAAGRCNREGRRSRGLLQVFVPPKPAPAGLLRIGAQACVSVLYGHQGDPLDRALFSRYFTTLYRDCNLDERDIAGLLKPDPSGGVVGLRTAAERFRLIDDQQVPVLVPYRGGPDDDRFRGLIAALRQSQGPDFGLLRKLQRYTVNLPPWEISRLRDTSSIEELFPDVWMLVSEAQYDPLLGLLVDAAPRPAGLVI
jgi:CRISPR-associated endonuclease/helicase Cas3